MSKSPARSLPEWIRESESNRQAWQQYVDAGLTYQSIADRLLSEHGMLTSARSVARTKQSFQDPEDDVSFPGALTIRQAAARMNLSVRAVERRVERGTLEAFKHEGRLFIRERDLLNATPLDDVRKSSAGTPNVPRKAEASLTIRADVATAITPPIEGPPKDYYSDPSDMIRSRGLDPEDWVIDTITINEWEGPKAGGSVVTFHQCKFTCKRKVSVAPLLVLPRTDGWIAPPKARLDPSRPRKVVVIGDQQAPFHDRGLHACFLQYLKVHQPDEMISLGDSYDFPDISRHPFDPVNNARVNECLQSGYEMFRDYVDAAPRMRIRKLKGNHDIRPEQYLISKGAGNLVGVARPETDDEPAQPVLDLAHLGRLDELGIEVVDSHGDYSLGQIALSDKLAVRHGWIVRTGSGASALKTLEHLGHSVIVGHTHRQAIVSQSKHEIDHQIRTLKGVEAGCMCRVSQEVGDDDRIWPSYAPAPDWTQGFVTVDIWPSGEFSVDLATYVNQALLWRNERYVSIDAIHSQI